MTATGHEKSVAPWSAARLAGVGYVVIFFLAIFANFVVREGLIVDGDAVATASNIRQSMGMFRLGFVAFLVVFLVDVVIAWALHIVFREVNRDASLVTAWFRLVYTVFLGVALVFMFQAMLMLNGASYLVPLSADQLNADVMVALESFNYTWLVGLAAFGVHLVLLGALAIRSGFVPRVLGALLILAGAAYGLDTVAHAMLPNYAEVATVFLVIVAVPSVLGEGWLGLWLLIRGSSADRWRTRGALTA